MYNKIVKKGGSMKKIRYYESYSDDFEKNSDEQKKISAEYKYIRTNPFFKITAFILYRLLATPAAFIYTKLFLREKLVGKEKLKKNRGYCLYATHNECVGDAFTPSVITFPNANYIIIHPDNFYVPLVGKVLPMLGGIPLPGDIRTARRFTECIGYHLGKGNCVTVYPEQHVWQGYAGVRPFDSTSFDFPARFDRCCYAVTRTYKKTRAGHRAVTYIDGPFIPDPSLSKRENADKLCREVYRAMCERAELSDCSPIEYVKKDSQK